MSVKKFYPVSIWKATGYGVKVAFGFDTELEAIMHGKKQEERYGDLYFTGALIEAGENVNEANEQIEICADVYRDMDVNLKGR